MIEMKHRVTIVETGDDKLTLEIDGKRVSAEWQALSYRLGEAPQVARDAIEVSTAG